MPGLILHAKSGWFRSFKSGDKEYPYPPLSGTAKGMMLAAIKKDRIANLEKWLIRIIVPVLTLISSFVGAYFGSGGGRK